MGLPESVGNQSSSWGIQDADIRDACLAPGNVRGPRTSGDFFDPSRGRGRYTSGSGGVAALDHRLMAFKPSACMEWVEGRFVAAALIAWAVSRGWGVPLGLRLFFVGSQGVALG